MVRRTVEGGSHSMATAEEREAPAATAVVNRANGSCALRSLAATMLWVGPIYLTVLLCLVALFLCRSTAALWIIGLLVVFTFGPVSENSRCGRAIARFIGKYSPGYFHVSVHIEDAKAFDDGKAYVLAAEPHSIFPIGAVSLLDITGLMPLSKTKVLASTALFCTPFMRQVTTWMGLIAATKRNFVSYLKAGYSCIIIPGGVQEIIYMNRDYEIAYLKKRHGFVRVAIETGSPLVPVFCFGQNNAFNWWKPEGKLYIRISRAIRFAPLFFWGVFGSPVPYRSPIHVVVGKPIEVKKNPNPSAEEVADLHARFLSSLEALFSKYRVATGHADTELRIL